MQRGLEQLGVGECFAADLAEAFAHPLPVARPQIDLISLGQPVDGRFGRLAHSACSPGCSGLKRPRGEAVKISCPVSVMPMECSACAERVRSRVTAVQPSLRILTCGRPRLIIGSMVKIMPGLSSMPVPGTPKCMMLGS